jgi:hypothetical protein
MQTGNQIVFPIPGYQYNADSNTKKRFSFPGHNIKMQIGNQIVFPIPADTNTMQTEYQYNADRNTKKTFFISRTPI